MTTDAAERRIAVVVKGYPRLSETFIAQEILALEERGLEIEIWSLRHPTERFVHPMHERIRRAAATFPSTCTGSPCASSAAPSGAFASPDSAA